MHATDPGTELVREQLGRILSSPGFARSERLARFLQFVVEQQLDGRADQIKESVIGVEVFGRTPAYDPRKDPVVRMEASKLRTRLAEYYAGEGLADPVAIEIPKGGYAPLILHRQTHPEPEPQAPRRLYRMIATAVLVLIAAALTLWWQQRKTADIAIAVLPFENLSADPGNDYFADGLTGEVIGQLDRIEGLAVRSRTSSFALKGQQASIQEAGKRLQADYILEASTLRSGQQLRVTARLVRVRDDVALWTGDFNRNMTDIFAIQDEISLGIVNSFRLKLGRGRRRYETSVAAYDLYLRARESRGPARIGLFQQAIDKDASFAPAYAGLASQYANGSIQFPGDHPSDQLAKMQSAAERAIALDPLSTEADRALGNAFARHGQWKEAEKHFREAIRLSPHDSANYEEFAMDLLRVLGSNDEAIEQLRTAHKLDPLYKDFEVYLGLVLISANRYEEAIEHCQNALDRPGLSKQCLGRARVFQGKFGEAIQILTPNRDRNPLMLGFLGYAYAQSGRTEDAKRMAAASDYPNERALIFAGLRDKEATLAALAEMAAATGPQRVGDFVHYPELAFLRDDPRMKAFRKQVGLD